MNTRTIYLCFEYNVKVDINKTLEISHDNEYISDIIPVKDDILIYTKELLPKHPDNVKKYMVRVSRRFININNDKIYLFVVPVG